MSNWFPKDLKKMREMLAWPDDVLGKYLLGAYIATTAERRGATKASQIKAIGNAIIEALRTVETLDVEVRLIPLEKALRIAALEKFAAAGRIFRDLLDKGSVDGFNENMAKIAISFRQAQRKKAGKPRGKVSDDGITINEFIGELATFNEHQEESTKELWPHFYWKLDDKGLDPEEKEHPSDLDKSYYSYNFKDKRKSIRFGRFANVVAQYRREN